MEIFLHFTTLAPKFTSKDRAKFKEIMHTTSSMMLMSHILKTWPGNKSSPDKNSKLYSRQKLLESLIKPLSTGGSSKLSADTPIDQHQLAFKKSLILILTVRTPWARMLRSTLRYDPAKPDKLFEKFKSLISMQVTMQMRFYPCTWFSMIRFQTNFAMNSLFKIQRSRIKALAFSGISFVVSLLNVMASSL